MPFAPRTKFASMQESSAKGALRVLAGTTKKNDDSEKLVKYINDNVIGRNSTFLGPFGKRKVVYCDYFGSGRALHFIEDFIQREVLPAYGASKPSVSHTSLQSSLYREEARSIVHDACRCSCSDRVVLGGGLESLARALRGACVVFVGATDVQESTASWTVAGAKIIRISETREGFIDLNDLETKLQLHTTTGEKLIGCFATASKVTGVLVDTVAATLILHQYGALAIWDHTLAASCCTLDMNPDLPGLEDSRMVQKDAAVFSCGRLIGGMQAATVLIVKKSLLNNDCFCESLKTDMEECDAVEAVRAGLVMQLKEAVGQQTITNRQENITRQVLAHVRNTPELILLCGDNRKRVPIFPLLVRHPRGAFLHHNFVCAVLSDVFGVQASSADCNGEMLGIDEDLAREYAKLLMDEGSSNSTNEHLRPGFCRISLPYFISDSELAFVLEALKMVATEAWKILPHYIVDPETGRWSHRTHSNLLAKKSLSSLTYSDGKMTFNEKPCTGPGTFPQTYYECLQTARNLFNSARKSAQRYPLKEQDFKFNARADYLRWYMLPMEAQELLLGNSANVKHIVPFDPVMFNSARKSVSSVSSGGSSPVPSSSPRHYSLSAIDTTDFVNFNSKFKSFSRESSIIEPLLIKPDDVKMSSVTPPPVHFAVGEEVTTGTLYNAPINKLINRESIMSRARCHSLGSDDSPPIVLTPQTRLSLGMNNSYMKTLGTCNCGSQTDLQSLDDFINSPSSSYMYTHKEHMGASNSDCSQLGRASSNVSVASNTSEDIHAYVKEMTKEIATEIKSEIREVISKVEDVLENSEAIELSNRSFCCNPNNASTQSLDSNSVSISDVAEYLMGVSREMASEVKHEIREMVNQVDEMISPDLNSSGVSFYLSSPSGSRKNSPPDVSRRRNRSGSEASFSRVNSMPPTSLDNLQNVKKTLKKSPTSPVILLPVALNSPIIEVDTGKESPIFFRAQQTIGQQTECGQSPQHSPDSLPLDVPCAGSLSFNSSDTSSPDTVIQVLNSSIAIMPVPKSISSHKLSDDENSCTESECQRLYCKNKIWYHNNSVSSQDSGINMSFVEHDQACGDTVKRRPSSDSSCYRRKRRSLKSSNLNQRQEKSEVPDIIEGVPVCSDDYRACCSRGDSAEKKLSNSRVDFQLHRDCEGKKDNKSSFSTSESSSSQRTSRTSTASSVDSSESRKSSGYNTDSFSSKKSSHDTVSSEDYARCSELSCCQHMSSSAAATSHGETCRSRLSSGSSSESEYPGDCVFDEDGKWHCPPKSVWKGTVEAMQEFGMIRHQDRVLVCLSGGAHSLSLLHTLHQYQFYARAKGIHFTIGAVTIRDNLSDVDPIHLMAYCKTLGIKYIYQDNLENMSTPHCALSRKQRDQDLCSFTNHWTRRQIYRAASEHGYNVIATGQHLDDVARSFIISVFSNGRLKTMKAHYYIKELNLRVIRPFIYVREKNLVQFVDSRHLPQFKTPKPNDEDQGPLENCVFGDDGAEVNVSPENEKAESHSAPERESSNSPLSKMNRSLSAPSGGRKLVPASTRTRACSAPCGPASLCGLLEYQEATQPGLFASLKVALHPLISARNIEKDMKEYRHRKRSVIQMKNGAPVYNSDDGTDEEAVP